MMDVALLFFSSDNFTVPSHLSGVLKAFRNSQTMMETIDVSCRQQLSLLPVHVVHVVIWLTILTFLSTVQTPQCS